jgi:serine protease AprX
MAIPTDSMAARLASRRTWLVLAASFAVLAGLFRPVGASFSALLKADPGLLAAASSHPSAEVPVIVRETTPSSDAAERLVRRLGGTVTYELPIVGGFAARVPGRAVRALASSADVAVVWGDGKLRMSSVMGQFSSWAPNTTWQKNIRLPQATQAGYTGAGVTVALLDTGISPNADLGNRVLDMVDFTPDHDGIDRYGHGTHMAGIIAGDGTLSNGGWTGVAPKANLVSVKVAGEDGSTDVSVVIAGMQWIVTHKAQYNIRIMNLSFGTDSTQSYLIDPLDYAVERVWASGILVVVAAGNRGPYPGTINDPANDPFVVTVGGANLNNTIAQGDDSVASFSSLGPTADGLAKPDLVAPSITIVSDRDPGSTIDQQYPSARVGDSYFKGTGTSQATAVVSGVAALMFQANPQLTPNVAKATLIANGMHYLASQPGAGSGLVDAYGSAQSASSGQYFAAPANVGLTPGTGLGSLDASRGSAHVYADLNGDGVADLVTGEIDVLGNSWSGNSWSGNSWSGNEWSAYVWDGNSWSGNSWSGNSWSGTSWSANSWSGNSWSGNTWSGNEWS